MAETPEDPVASEEHPARHPDPGLLERFLSGRVAAVESRRIVRHLLAGCPSCVAVTRRVWTLAGGHPGPPSEGPTPARRELELDQEYDTAIERALGASRLREEELAVESAAAPGLLARLLAQPAERRLALARRDEDFRSVPLVELLLDQDSGEGRPAAFGYERRHERAELAAALADQLDPAACGPSVVRDLRGRAWVRTGETRLLAGDLPGAERARRQAAALLLEAAPAERWELLRLEAALAGRHGRAEEADRLLARAVDLWRSADEPLLAGKALVERGTLHATSGRDESALVLLEEGLDLLERTARTPPAFLAATHHRRADLLCELGRKAEARAAAERVLPFYERAGDRAGLLRLAWLQAKIEEDETALLATRAELLAQGLGLAAAQASLDLAVIYARKGRADEIRRLSQEIFPIFRTGGLGREAIAALLVFRRAVETESASLEFLVEVARYLLGSRRSRWGLP
jgi:tetratricopeptide (TPR) repeat protein